jgi:pimeloyl-ACP methyl ester carboxylesterase
MSTTWREFDVRSADGRILHAYDTAQTDADANRVTVVWHHGTPNIGLPPEPLLPASDPLGIRWVSYDRPGYGGSDHLPGRIIASAAADVEALADALGVGRFAVMGHSSGAAHALACAALLPGRVTAAVGVSSLAPIDAAGLAWFAGMGPTGQATLRAATSGRVAKERYEASAAHTRPDFTPADWAALEGEWSWFGKVVGPAVRAGPSALIDDDLANVAPWGFDPADVGVPTLLLHGDVDLVAPATHAAWLATRIPSAELWLKPDDGHISVLLHAADALAWLAGNAGARHVPGRG